MEQLCHQGCNIGIAVGAEGEHYFRSGSLLLDGECQLHQDKQGRCEPKNDGCSPGATHGTTQIPCRGYVP